LGLRGVPAKAAGSSKTYLTYLRRVVADPRLNSRGADLIGAPLERFATWLDGEFTVQNVWLSNVEIELDLTMTRLESIKICSNISKHNFSRLGVDVGSICRIMGRNGRAITEEEDYLLLPNFYEWFHGNIFTYHTSHIGEMLSALIWGIYDYLFPEFVRAYVKDRPGDPDDILYHYDVPVLVGEGLPRVMYWDLMNDICGKPYMPRFRASWSLTERY
jgi:hypothetical protein